MKVVKLAYYDEFHCIGPECTDTCCKQWSIYFSKRDYLKHKNAHCSSELKSVLEQSLVRIKGKDKDENSYAMIKFDENNMCPMLNSDGLCMVQKELGEKALSAVCFTFPRLFGQVGKDAAILACNTTCPHVVEMLMNYPEGLRVEEEELNNARDLNNGIFSLQSVTEEWEGYPYYWAIKNAQIDILQNRNFNIPERMLILGYFSKKANDYLNNNQGEKIQGLANTLLDNEVCKKIADSLKTSQSDESGAKKSIETFSKMIDLVKKEDSSNALKEYFYKAAESIKLKVKEEEDRKISILFDLEQYLLSVEKYRKIESERPYIIENILLNTIFTQVPVKGVWLNYFVLAVFYNLLKICVPAFLPEDYTDRDLALALTYTSKMLLNTRIIDQRTSFDFMIHNSFDLPHAAFLIS